MAIHGGDPEEASGKGQADGLAQDQRAKDRRRDCSVLRHGSRQRLWPARAGPGYEPPSGAAIRSAPPTEAPNAPGRRARTDRDGMAVRLDTASRPRPGAGGTCREQQNLPPRCMEPARLARSWAVRFRAGLNILNFLQIQRGTRR